MHPELVELLACPVTGEPLQLDGHKVEGGVIEEGLLRTASGGRAYPISGGIPRLLSDPGKGRRTRASFGLQWHRCQTGKLEAKESCYGYDVVETTRFLFNDVLGGETPDGELLLDAGCGAGDKAAGLAGMGYRVVAFDLTDSVDGARARFGESKQLQFIQADVLRPPFRPECFDAIISTGVLHHTPDARAGFGALAKLQRPRGRLGVWIYPKDRRQVNVFLSRLYFIRDLLPGVEHLPPAACYAVSMLVAAGLYPLFRRHFHDLRKGASPTEREIYQSILMNTYDFLSPRYQSRHAPEEVARWFEEEGYTAPERKGSAMYVARKERG